MKNNELKTKSIRLVAYRPLELGALINKEDAYGMDKEKIKEIIARVLDYPYAYELCTLWAVYKIDNFKEPLFFVEICGINGEEKIELNLYNNTSRTIDLDKTEVNEAIKLLIKYIKGFDPQSIIINNDNDIYNLIENKKESNVFYKSMSFKLRLLVAILSPLAFFIIYYGTVVFAYLNSEIYCYYDIWRVISYIIGIPLLIGLILINLLLFGLPIIQIISELNKKHKKLYGLIIAINCIAFIINISIFRMFIAV